MYASIKIVWYADVGSLIFFGMFWALAFRYTFEVNGYEMLYSREIIKLPINSTIFKPWQVTNKKESETIILFDFQNHASDLCMMKTMRHQLYSLEMRQRCGALLPKFRKINQNHCDCSGVYLAANHDFVLGVFGSDAINMRSLGAGFAIPSVTIINF